MLTTRSLENKDTVPGSNMKHSQESDFSHNELPLL